MKRKLPRWAYDSCGMGDEEKSWRCMLNACWRCEHSLRKDTGTIESLNAYGPSSRRPNDNHHERESVHIHLHTWLYCGYDKIVLPASCQTVLENVLRGYSASELRDSALRSRPQSGNKYIYIQRLYSNHAPLHGSSQTTYECLISTRTMLSFIHWLRERGQWHDEPQLA